MAFLIFTVLVITFVLVLCWVLAQDKQGGSTQAFDAELWRIEHTKRAAIDEIRRRRQYAEEQVRRLGRWSR